MAVFRQDMEELLINAGCLYMLDSLEATHKGGDLMLMWQDAEASAEYFCNYNFLDGDTLHEARFFVMADYLTYIPYGSVGYAAFKDMLKDVYPEMSVGQYRYEWLKRCAGERLSWLNDGQLAYIKYFFDNYEKGTVNPKIPAEIVALICRYHHECEANFSKKGFVNLMDISKWHTDGFSRRIAEMYGDVGIDCDNFLKEVPPYGELGKEERDFMLAFTGLRRKEN